MTLKKYIIKLINDYYYTYDKNKKKHILKTINNIIDSISINDFYEEDQYIEIRKIFRNFIKDIKYKKKPVEESYKKYFDSASADLDYLKELLKHIKIRRNIYNFNINNGTIDNLEDYIKGNNSFLKFYKNLKYDIILDREFISGLTVKTDDKCLFILENLNISLLLHELMHVYNNYSFSKYFETPSIISEMAIAKRYNVDFDFDRVDDISNLKRISNNGIKDLNDYYAYCYGIGTIMGISFINKYGNDFSDIIKVIDYIIKNKSINLLKLFKNLNLKENEIIDSTNNIEKILSKKSRQ